MNYRFNFKKYPELLELYEVYRKLELKATGYSMKDSKRAGEQLTKANQKSSEYAYSILAKAIYDVLLRLNQSYTKDEVKVHIFNGMKSLINHLKNLI